MSVSGTATSLDLARVWTQEQLAEAASEIAAQLYEHRVYARDGSVTWLGPTGYGTALNPLQVAKLGPHLYNGTTGVALFLAALECVRGEGEHRELCLQVIAPLRRKLAELIADPERANRLKVPVGGLIGLGSFLYGFLKIGQLLDESSLIREAQNITALITQMRIDRDDNVRIQMGIAGTALALLALHRVAPEQSGAGKTPLELAIDCGQHLLKTRVSVDGSPRAWPLSPGKPPLAGFSYGAAGVCYALLQLYEATGQTEFWEAGQEGLSFVRSLYSPEHRSWRDGRIVFQNRYEGPVEGTWRDWWASGGPLKARRSGGGGQVAEDRFLGRWCHGASGIILSRIALLHIDDSPEIREEIQDVLDATRGLARCEATIDDAEDDICCGGMGRVEVLHYAHQKLGDEESLAAAHVLASHIWRRAKAHGGYRLTAARGTDTFAPSLFQGISGIGYSLLRLARPESVPCVVLLE